MKNYEHKIINISDLIPYVNNSRVHSETQINQIVSSINEWGFTNPVLIDENNGVIAGHGRLLAAEKCGIQEVPCIVLDGLTEIQKKAYIIADNKLAMNATWDDELLGLELQGLDDFDLSLLGFDEDELDLLLPTDEQEGLTDEDAVPEVPEEPISKRGDVWLLGIHRVMCGDSTMIDDVEKLMDGNKADMVFTDPPYGVNYDGGIGFDSRGKQVKWVQTEIKNDNIDLYEEAVLICSMFCNGPIFMFYADTVPFGLYRGIEKVNGHVVALIIWKKRGGYGALGAAYKANHEPCVIWKLKKSKLNFTGSTKETRIWEEEKDGNNKLHPTQKPVALAERAIGNHNANIVFDLFGGSGSTLIACEKTNRNCYMMELDEKYCDVIIKRWQEYTGKTAILESTGEEFKEAA